jgi:hypothetical protein
MPILSLNGSSLPWNGSGTTLAQDVSYLSLATSRSVRSSTATIVYRLRNDVVEIATAFHGSRLWSCSIPMSRQRSRQPRL